MRRIDSVEVAVQARRREFADLVRSLGISASARAMGITPQALSERIRSIEAKERRPQ